MSTLLVTNNGLETTDDEKGLTEGSVNNKYYATRHATGSQDLSVAKETNKTTQSLASSVE